MRRTALLIGSQTYGLTGVDHDVDTMAELLASRGFTVERRNGAQAGRAEILDSFERLIRQMRYADAAVVYFSGHGGVAVPDRAPGARQPAPRLQFLVPTDFSDSTPSDFRGITDAELSVLLARLTRVTPNATMIIDSCHAAHMARDSNLRPKALYQYAYLDLTRHLETLRSNGFDPSIRHVLGNQDAVRVEACGRDQSAYEYTNDEGRRIGVFTESLAVAFREAGKQPVTWATLIERVRNRVRLLAPNQRPEAAGPSLRLPFQARVSYPPDRPPALGPAGQALGADVGIEWGRVVDGRPHPLPFEGAAVRAGDHVYVRVRNKSAHTVYVSLMLVEEFARVSLITSGDPSGIALRSGQEQTVGRDEPDGRLVGIELTWPAGVDRHDCLQRTITVLVGSAPLDMALAQRPAIYRDLSPVTNDAQARRDVHPINFELRP